MGGYVNPALVDPQSFTSVRHGFRVDRASDTLPAGPGAGTEALFTVSGGRVLILGLIGEVTVAIQNQANDTKLTANPTVGTSVDLCAALNIANDELGALYSITGAFTDAMIGGVAGAVGIPEPFVVPEGTIDLDCAATNTGEIKWSLWYVPLDAGASVAAA